MSHILYETLYTLFNLIIYKWYFWFSLIPILWKRKLRLTIGQALIIIKGQSYFLNKIRLTQKVTFLTIIHSFSLLKVSIYLISIQRVLLNLLILTTVI